MKTKYHIIATVKLYNMVDKLYLYEHMFCVAKKGGLEQEYHVSHSKKNKINVMKFLEGYHDFTDGKHKSVKEWEATIFLLNKLSKGKKQVTIDF